MGFRYTAYYFTRDLYLTGWVDNKSDGSVEMEAQGGPMHPPRAWISGQGILKVQR